MKPLIGSKAIEQFYGRDWELIMKFISEEKFPAVKDNGIWVSDEESIYIWHKTRIEMMILKKGCQ